MKIMRTRIRLDLSFIKFVGVLMCSLTSTSTSAQTQVDLSKAMDSPSWFYVSIGASDLDGSLSLWKKDLGMVVVHKSDGQGDGLSRVWGLPADAISRQYLLSGSEEGIGFIHLVEFGNPLGPVREDATLYDSLPKSVDFFVDDIGSRSQALRSSGYNFRSEKPQAFDVGSGTAHEIQMPGPDHTNIVFIQKPNNKAGFNHKGFRGVGMFIATVTDIDAEQAFFTELLDLSVVTTMDLSGPELERATGLPTGTEWIIRILGNEDSDVGQIEFVEYKGLAVHNLYNRAVPRALGLTEVTYLRSELTNVLQHLESIGRDFALVKDVILFDQCFDSLRTNSPAGMPIQILSPSSNCG